MGRRIAGCYTRAHAHTHTRADTHTGTSSLPSIISQDTGKAPETGKASVNRHEAQDRILQELERPWQGAQPSSGRGQDSMRFLGLEVPRGK